MKKIFFLFASLLLLMGMAGCYSDDGNYDYLSAEEAGDIKIDTIGHWADVIRFQTSLNPGQTYQLSLNVSYAHPERLRYRWFYLPLTNYQYLPVQEGNALVYPKADTIATTKDLNWTCDLKAGQYRFYFMAEDSVTGMKSYYQFGNFNDIKSSGVLGGLYLLTERDGQADIEVYQSPLMFIYEDSCYYRFYSSTHGACLPGKPRFIRGTTTGQVAKDGYLVATDENLYRLSADGLNTVNSWDDMFYEKPATFNPQNSFYVNNCDFLLNNGKLHVLYTNQTNDRKFSAPIAGDYTASPFLMKQTRTTWRPVTGAINAWQVIYDEQHQRFMPYYSKRSSMSLFHSASDSAYVDASHVPGTVKVVFQGGSYQTNVITEVDGKPMLYRYQFYNVIDNGNLSAAGNRSIIDLSGCTGINEAKRFCANTDGNAFYYATDNAVYSFSPSSGLSTANTLYTCEPGETVTAIYIWGSDGGGWPTSECVMWIGVWNEQKKDGKLIQYEMDINYGVPASMWGPMFGAPDNPVITTGWGKIVDMTNIDAE